MKSNVTMYSIAKKLNISVSEVSRAFTKDYPMNSEKRSWILNTAESMGYIRNESASRLSMKPLHIGILYTELVPEFYGHILEGIKDAETRLFSYKILCDYRCVDAENSPSLSKIEEALIEFCDNHYDGVLIAATADNIDIYIRKYAPFLKIGLINFDVDDSERLFASVNDTYTVACSAAHILSMFRSPDDPGETLVFTGDPSAWTHKMIVNHFLPEADHLSMHVTDVYSAMDDTDLEKQLDSVFQRHPKISGIYMTSAISIPLLKRINDLGLRGKIKIVTSDIYERLVPYLQNGTVVATLWQNPRLQAYRALESLVSYLINDIKPDDRLIIRPEIIMKSNLHLYI